MKTIFKCIILLVVTYLVVNFFTYFVTKPHYTEFNQYEVLTKNPEVEITECKRAYTKGYIKGSVKNTTGEIIDLACIKATLYNNDKQYLGTKYYSIPYFYPQEENNFELNFEYKNVGNIEIEVVKKSLDEEKIRNDLGIKDEEITPYLIITLILFNPIVILAALGI